MLASRVVARCPVEVHLLEIHLPREHAREIAVRILPNVRPLQVGLVELRVARDVAHKPLRHQRLDEVGVLELLQGKLAFVSIEHESFCVRRYVSKVLSRSSVQFRGLGECSRGWRGEGVVGLAVSS